MVVLTRPVSGGDRETTRVVQARCDTPGAEVLAMVPQSDIESLPAGQRISFRALHGGELRYTRDELLGIRSASAGAFGWRLEALRSCVDQLPRRSDDAQYWTTHLVEALRKRRFMVRAFPVDHIDESTQMDAEQALEKAGRACSELVDAARALARPRGTTSLG